MYGLWLGLKTDKRQTADTSRIHIPRLITASRVYSAMVPEERPVATTEPPTENRGGFGSDPLNGSSDGMRRADVLAVPPEMMLLR